MESTEKAGCSLLILGYLGFCWVGSIFIPYSWLEVLGATACLLAVLTVMAVLFADSDHEETDNIASRAVYSFLGGVTNHYAQIIPFSQGSKDQHIHHVKTRRKQLAELHEEVRSRFIYQTDLEQFGVDDDWRSHADALEIGKHFTDDCDGFALTCCELTVRRNIAAPYEVFFITCNNTGHHAVCGVALDKDHMLILDNMYDHIYEPNHKPEISWVAATTLENVKEWREINFTQGS